tara:strand:+ start:541 stop:729 length:189 start_codon:yes stop_codon:yes gene_type:complete
MSIFEFLFIFFLAVGIIPNKKLIYYYKKISRLRNSPRNDRKIIGDDSIDEDWYWLNEEGKNE